MNFEKRYKMTTFLYYIDATGAINVFLLLLKKRYTVDKYKNPVEIKDPLGALSGSVDPLSSYLDANPDRIDPEKFITLIKEANQELGMVLQMDYVHANYKCIATSTSIEEGLAHSYYPINRQMKYTLLTGVLNCTDWLMSQFNGNITECVAQFIEQVNTTKRDGEIESIRAYKLNEIPLDHVWVPHRAIISRTKGDQNPTFQDVLGTHVGTHTHILDNSIGDNIC